MLNRRPRGSAFCWLSLPHLVSISSDLQLTDFLSLPSYIIVQSPTQSLEWHVSSSSGGNNCYAVQRSLSSGASVYKCIMGFYLVPFRLLNPPTRFLSITGHWNVSLPSGASLWNGMFGRVEGQNTTREAVICSSRSSKLLNMGSASLPPVQAGDVESNPPQLRTHHSRCQFLNQSPLRTHHSRCQFLNQSPLLSHSDSPFKG